MSKEIVIDPITRIEGHAKVTIHLADDGTVQEARFHVEIFRGFEKFCEGRPFYEMPSITSRICGICPVSHLLASAKACDDMLSVSIPRTATQLRRLMHMGQIIQSHALSFFHLSSPDILLGMDADPSKRNIFGLIDKYPDLARQGIRLRRFGQVIIESLSSKRIHSSSWLLPGGISTPLSRDKAQRLLAQMPEALDITLKTTEMFKKSLPKLMPEVEDFGNFPSYYMGLVTPDGGLEHYDGKIRIVDPKGKIVSDYLDPSRYTEYIGEATESWSYMKFPYYKPLGYPDGAYRVGPLARLNIVSHCGTPLADEELKEFKKLGKNGIVQSSFLYHYARLVELLFCIERTKELLEDSEIFENDIQSKASFNRREGVGVLEAPRGTLFHHYKANGEGIITGVNLIIATAHNNLAFNKAVTQVARRYVDGHRLNEGMLNRVEVMVRALDPCLSCSTHMWRNMPLSIVLHDSRGNVLDKIRR
ncbi:MAG: NAD-reducing hydrogenase large subunit [Thermoproteota archaeon]|nr:NAD-reducing hydrogenase large subunit [Thermoproteota archaeon]